MRGPDGRSEGTACVRLISLTPGKPRMHALPHGGGSTNGSTPPSPIRLRRVTFFLRSANCASGRRNLRQKALASACGGGAACGDIL